MHNRAFWPLVALAAWSAAATAQDTTTLNLARTRATARAASFELAAARAAVDAARARERQSAAYFNPVLTYDREQVSTAGLTNSQDILAVHQTIERPGIRGARRSAARSRHAVAEARLRLAETQLDHDVAIAYARAWGADRRAAFASDAFKAFSEALTVAERRFQEGDISGFAARRIRLEAARYAALGAEAALASRTARLALATLMGGSRDSLRMLRQPLSDSALTVLDDIDTDSLVVLAMRSRADLAARAFELEASTADARLAARERLPSFTLSAGSKSEAVTGGARLGGFIAGVALPVPLWDRRGGAVGAAQADVRRQTAEVAVLRRRVIHEVMQAADALRTAQEQLQVLSPALRNDAVAALRSAQVAYTEGELTLLEWLDTVRAYHETSIAIANLRAELLVRAAILEQAVGVPLFRELP